MSREPNLIEAPRAEDANLRLRSRVGNQALVVVLFLAALGVAAALVDGRWFGLIAAAVIAPAALALRFIPLVILEGDRLEVRKAAGRRKELHSLRGLRSVGPLTGRVLRIETDAGPLELPVAELSLADALLLAAALQQRVEASSAEAPD